MGRWSMSTKFWKGSKNEKHIIVYAFFAYRFRYLYIGIYALYMVVDA
jgi:hypothetical protein